MDAAYTKQKEQKARKDRADEHRGNQWDAERRTSQAEKVRKSLDLILKEGIAKARRVSWDALTAEEPFKESAPPRATSREPDPNDYQYRPNVGLLGWMIAEVRNRRVMEAQERFDADLKRWQK